MKTTVSTSVVLVLSAILVACTASPGSSGGEPSAVPLGPDRTPAPSASDSAIPTASSPSDQPTASTVASPAPSPGGTITVRAHFILDGPIGSAGLVPVLRELPTTPAVARAAMQALLDGPSVEERAASPAVSSSIPGDTDLLDLSIEDGVATVDLSAEFEAGGRSASHIRRLGQVVYTLTQFPTVDSVAFRMDGRSVTRFGDDGVVLDGPVGRADLVDVEPFQSMFESALPAIFVDGPAWGAALDNPHRVSGTANTYEAWLMVSLFDAAGRQLYESPVQATCGTGCRGTFELSVAYAVAEAQWGTLRVLDGDESGETNGIVREYPVWLTPGPPVEREGFCGC